MGPVGAVLLLAVAITLYAQSVHRDVPRWGAEAEAAWDQQVGSAMSQLARGAASGIGASAAATSRFPPPSPPRALDVPLLGRTEPLRASGSVSFEPSCTRFDASHAIDGYGDVKDFTSATSGCMVFRSSTVYSRPFTYRLELGGVLRIQDGEAVVLAGPPLELNTTATNDYQVALAMPGLTGAGLSATTDGTGAVADLLAGPSSMEIAGSANAASVSWTLETPYPKAWKSWLDTRFERSRFVAVRGSPAAGESAADYTLACDPVDCSVGSSGLGRVKVTIEGPRTDRNDLRLSLSYGLYRVALR